MDQKVRGTIHFVDGTSLKLEWKRNDERDPVTIVSEVRRAIEKDRFIFETNGELILIPVQNIKYLNLSPTPKALPKDMIIQGATIVG